MFLAQVPSTQGLKVSAIADLDPEGARRACRNVGWSEALTKETAFTDDATELAARADVDVVVEATGDPSAGIAHARAAIASGKHVVMVNVEGDVLAGPLNRRRSGGRRCRLHDGLRRSARAHLRNGGVGPLLRLRRGCRGQGHQVPPRLPCLHPRHNLGPLRAERGRGGGGGNERAHVQLLPRRDQVRHRDGGNRERDRSLATARRTRVPALRNGRPRARAAPEEERRSSPPQGPGGGGFLARAGRASGRARPALGRLRGHRGAQPLQRRLLPPVWSEHRRKRSLLRDVQALPPDRAGAQRVDPLCRFPRPSHRRHPRLRRRRGRDREARSRRGRAPRRRRWIHCVRHAAAGASARSSAPRCRSVSHAIRSCCDRFGPARSSPGRMSGSTSRTMRYGHAARWKPGSDPAAESRRRALGADIRREES